MERSQYPYLGSAHAFLVPEDWLQFRCILLPQTETQ